MGNSKSREAEVVRFVDAHRVKMVAKNANHRGILGATYKIASKDRAYRPRDNEKPIRFGEEAGTQDNIFIDLYFREHRDAFNFVDHVREMHAVPDLIKRSYFPDFVGEEVKQYRIELSRFTPVGHQDFEVFTPAVSIDYHSSCQDLGSFPSRSSGKRASSTISGSTPSRNPRKKPRSPGGSGRITRNSGKLTPTTAGDPNFTWQTVEDPTKIGQPYNCHLDSREYNPRENRSNYLCGSGAFHQFLDGMNLTTPYKVPALVVEFDRVDGSTQQAVDGIRHKVFLRIRFRDETNDKYMKDEFRNRLKNESKVKPDGSVETFVHVLDVEDFRENLELKRVRTLSKWRRCVNP